MRFSECSGNGWRDFCLAENRISIGVLDIPVERQDGLYESAGKIGLTLDAECPLPF